MEEDIDRILKGYRPRSKGTSYFILMVIIRLLLLLKGKMTRLQKDIIYNNFRGGDIK